MLDSFDDGLYRGPTPDVSELAEAGIATIINLEASPAEMFWENAQLRAAHIQEFPVPCCPLMPPSIRQSVKVQAVLRARLLRPAYLHCRHGEDRTGFEVALYRIVEHGWSFERAEQEMREKGFHYWCFFWWMPELRRQAAILKKAIHRL